VESVEHLVVGAGVSGLAFANWMRAERAARGQPAPELLVLEAEAEPGGWCRTVRRDGFVWDYSGHFFHFRHPEIEAWLRARMAGQDVLTVTRRALIRYAGRDIDFPFQKNIHQLPLPEFLDCLYHLFFRDAAGEPRSFKQMVQRRLGTGIAERFLIPYNEKLYACDLDELDADAMGRFFPHADVADIIRNLRHPEPAGYNSTFTYPRGGAIEYIYALLHDLPAGTVALSEPLLAVDVAARVATTPTRQIRYQHLISSAPLPRLLAMCGLAHDAAAFHSNKVLIFNLGFDRKGPRDVHWMYFPDRSLPFYRVGWYDNILGTDRMSLYVEIGAPTSATFDLDAQLAAALDGLRREHIVTDHQLLAHHTVTLDPAYVHITQTSLAETSRALTTLRAAGIHSVGRYGRWTYCAIEDNIVETRTLAATLSGGSS
jgi:protoporphyrinogen oxidase